MTSTPSDSIATTAEVTTQAQAAMSRSEAREVVELYLVAGAEPLLTENLQEDRTSRASGSRIRSVRGPHKGLDGSATHAYCTDVVRTHLGVST